GGRLRGRDPLPRRLGLPRRAAGDGRAGPRRRVGAGTPRARARARVRVLHVHRMRGIGGSERHLLTLLPALAERGVEPVLVGLDDPAWDPADFYGALRVPAVRIPAPRDLDPLLLARLAAVAGADGGHTA